MFGIGNPNLDGHFGIYNRFAVSPDGQRFLLSQPGTGGVGQGSGGGPDATLRGLADALSCCP
jgi:hypothetical protein